MIPDLICAPPEQTLVLPVGVHPASVGDVKARFTWNEPRRRIFGGFVNAARYLRDLGCKRLYLGGSFVTSKEEPGDFDGCWDPFDVDLDRLDPMFLDMPRRRHEQQGRYRGELYLGAHDVPGFDARPKYFQQDDRSSIQKGIVEIPIRT